MMQSCNSAWFLCAQNLCSGSLGQEGEQGEGDTRGGGSQAQCEKGQEVAEERGRRSTD